jgi:hypothetical protein
VFHTAGDPPSRGSTRRDITGWTVNSRNADANNVAAKPASSTEPAAERLAITLSLVEFGEQISEP